MDRVKSESIGRSTSTSSEQELTDVEWQDLVLRICERFNGVDAASKEEEERAETGIISDIKSLLVSTCSQWL